jgi:hypothetical protein
MCVDATGVNARRGWGPAAFVRRLRACAAAVAWRGRGMRVVPPTSTAASDADRARARALFLYGTGVRVWGEKTDGSVNAEVVVAAASVSD